MYAATPASVAWNNEICATYPVMTTKDRQTIAPIMVLMIASR